MLQAARSKGETMPLSLAYALLALAIVLIVFLVVNRVRGQRFALVAAVLTFMSMFALFVTMVMFITSRMR